MPNYQQKQKGASLNSLHLIYNLQITVSRLMQIYIIHDCDALMNPSEIIKTRFSIYIN